MKHLCPRIRLSRFVLVPPCGDDNKYDEELEIYKAIFKDVVGEPDDGATPVKGNLSEVSDDSLPKVSLVERQTEEGGKRLVKHYGKGMKVYCKNVTGMQLCTILDVHLDDPLDLYYTVRIEEDGRVKDTSNANISLEPDSSFHRTSVMVDSIAEVVDEWSGQLLFRGNESGIRVLNDVKSYHTAEELTINLYHATGIPPQHLIVKCYGRVLDGNRTLASSGVTEGSTLDLQVRGRGGMDEVTPAPTAPQPRRRRRSRGQSASAGQPQSRRRTTRHSGLSLDSSVTGPVSSIREGARCFTQSAGSQSSTNSIYDLNYRQNNRHQHSNSVAANCNLDTAAFSQPPSNPRICLCDRTTAPANCTKGCSVGVDSITVCASHRIIHCSNESCNNEFHAECVADYQHTSLDNIQGYRCMECMCNTDGEVDTPFVELDESDNEDVAEMLARCGIPCPDNPTERAEAIKQMRDMLGVMEDCVAVQHRDDIMNSKPRSYPSPVGMSEKSINNHLIHGRNFSAAMLMYKVDSCSCCGLVQPGHCYPNFPDKTAPFERKHLMMKYHNAWHCNCNTYCKGSQFYAANRRTVMAHYKDKHEGKNPWDVLDCPRTEHNARICEKCYNEVASTNFTGTCLFPTCYTSLSTICLTTQTHCSNLYLLHFTSLLQTLSLHSHSLSGMVLAGYLPCHLKLRVKMLISPTPESSMYCYHRLQQLKKQPYGRLRPCSQL